MMIRGVVDNYHGVPSRVAGTASQMLKESEVGFLVEFPFLPLVNQLTIAQPNGSAVTDTLARGMVPEDRIDDFRRDPHPPRDQTAGNGLRPLPTSPLANPDSMLSVFFLPLL
jgi:hypothetical protein